MGLNIHEPENDVVSQLKYKVVILDSKLFRTARNEFRVWKTYMTFQNVNESFVKLGA